MNFTELLQQSKNQWKQAENERIEKAITEAVHTLEKLIREAIDAGEKVVYYPTELISAVRAAMEDAGFVVVEYLDNEWRISGWHQN